MVSVTNKRLTIQAQTYARAQTVTGTRAVLHDAQILASKSFATHARYSCGFRLDLQAHVRWTLRLVERPPPSVVKFNVGPLGKTKNALLHKISEPARAAGLCCERHSRDNLGVVQIGASACHCLRASRGLRLNCTPLFVTETNLPKAFVFFGREVRYSSFRL